MAGKIQNEDIKTSAELATAGGTDAQLPNDTKLYLSAKTKTLAAALSDGTIEYVAPEFDNGNGGSAKTVNLANGLAQKLTLNNATPCVLTLTNPLSGQSYLIKLVQDATGGRAITWPGTVKWPLSTAPTLSGANKIDLINLYWDGTNYFGSFSTSY